MQHSYPLAARAAHLLRRTLAGCGLLLALLLPGVAHAQAPTFATAASFHPDGIYGVSGGRATATDAAGNQYVTGFFDGTITMGGTTFRSVGSTTNSFVAKRSASTGAWLWAVPVGNAFSYGIAVDGSGNVLVTGSFYYTATFAATPTTAISLVSAGGKDVFVAKFGGSDGACAWAVRAGGASDDTSAGIAVDGSGNALEAV